MPGRRSGSPRRKSRVSVMFGSFEFGRLVMQVLDHVEAAVGHVAEQGRQGNLLVVRGVAAVVDDDVELAADLRRHRVQFGAAALVGLPDRGARIGEAGEVDDVEAVDFGPGQVVRPHAQAGAGKLVDVLRAFGLDLAVHQADFEHPQRGLAQRRQQRLVDAGVAVGAVVGRALVAAVAVGQPRQFVIGPKLGGHCSCSPSELSRGEARNRLHQVGHCRGRRRRHFRHQFGAILAQHGDGGIVALRTRTATSCGSNSLDGDRRGLKKLPVGSTPRAVPCGATLSTSMPVE
jgi:hypothetical protein